MAEYALYSRTEGLVKAWDKYGAIPVQSVGVSF